MSFKHQLGTDIDVVHDRVAWYLKFRRPAELQPSAAGFDFHIGPLGLRMRHPDLAQLERS